MKFVYKRLLAVSFALILAFGVVVPRSFATTTAPAGSLAPAAKISFTFDDGLDNAYQYAAPTLQKYGLTGTNYVITGCVGMSSTPNTCRADKDKSYMTWEQIQALQNTYGWEIASHTVHHYCLASSAAEDKFDCQKNYLTTAQIDAELGGSKKALADHGINATDLSVPYGDYNPTVIAEVAKYYASMRGFQDQNYNEWPYNDYLLNDVMVMERKTTVADIEARIDAGIANKTWTILTFHSIVPNPSQHPYYYEYGQAELDQIAAYVHAKQDAGLLQSVNISQGLVTSSANLLPNSSFNYGITQGWSTPNPASVLADNAKNGSYPAPNNSIKFIANDQNIRLYSPYVNVNYGTLYALKTYLNVAALSGGDVEFYIDEYDANGNWISGQYKRAETTRFAEDFNFGYTPSSANVAQAGLQITVTANSAITAYVDNVRWYQVQ